MRILSLTFVCILTLTLVGCTRAIYTESTENAGVAPHGLVIHGGAGGGSRATISPELEAQMREASARALKAGFDVLDQGGSSLDAVAATIVVLEEAPVFNAGKGAVYNARGGHELDASIMDGFTLNAGAVAGVKQIRNPILLARAVMDRSPHVLLSGEGAEHFAREHNLEFVSPSFFDTERRRKQLDERLLREQATLREPMSGRMDPSTSYFGTVGVVALDKQGRLAAGTSTGGMTAKRYGRVGDSPVIGAGTYANGECGVSSTGHGEFFIRHVVAYTICARMAFQSVTLEQAANTVIMSELVEVGGSGGVVAMDADGNIAWPFNSASMVRAHQSRDQPPRVLIFKDDSPTN
ncbi:MAG: isoaspartyl peptidase/L-asparaginase [Pseudomonadota bacterium]